MGIRICIISFRKRLLDDDNFVAGAKQLRDIISHAIGTDDADSRLAWEYGQVVTRGRQGTLVKIDLA